MTGPALDPANGHTLTKDRYEGKNRDQDEEEISRDGQQEGRPLPPPDDGHEKH